MFVCLFVFVEIIYSKITDEAAITAHPKNAIRVEGDVVTLSCNATGNPEPSISWTKDGSPISSNSRISLSADNKQLTVTNVSRTDSGKYLCVANNKIGNVTWSAALLEVQCKYQYCDKTVILQLRTVSPAVLKT